ADPQRSAPLDLPWRADLWLCSRASGRLAPSPRRGWVSLSPSWAAPPMSLPLEMRAVVFERPGVFGLRTVPSPVPESGHAVIRVRASMVCATDRKVLDGTFTGVAFPHVPGHEFSGEVAASDPDGRGPSLGTRVGVEVHVGCGSRPGCEGRGGRALAHH